jgi:hypothetical protein
MSTPNFRDALHDDLSRFDTAAGDDLAAFDAATGETFIPAGWYACLIARGEIVTTRTTSKTAYRLALDVADGPHRGFRIWRYFTFDTPVNANRAKAALAPLGLRTSTDLRKPFPGPGRTVIVRALVTVQDRPDGSKANNLERFEITEDRTAPVSRNTVNPEDFTGGTLS